MPSGQNKNIEKGKERQPEAPLLRRAQMSGKAQGEQYQRMAEYSQQQRQADRSDQPALPSVDLELRLGLPGTQTEARQQAGGSHDQIQGTVFEESQPRAFKRLQGSQPSEQAPEHRSSSQQPLHDARAAIAGIETYRAGFPIPEREHTLQLQQEEMHLDKGTPSESDSGSELSQTRKRKRDQTSHADEDPGPSHEVVGPSHQAEIGHEQPQDIKLSFEQKQSLDAFIKVKMDGANKKNPFNKNLPFTKEDYRNAKEYIKGKVPEASKSEKIIQAFYSKMSYQPPESKVNCRKSQKLRRLDPKVKKRDAEAENLRRLDPEVKKKTRRSRKFKAPRS